MKTPGGVKLKTKMEDQIYSMSYPKIRNGAGIQMGENVKQIFSK